MAQKQLSVDVLTVFSAERIRMSPKSLTSQKSPPILLTTSYWNVPQLHESYGGLKYIDISTTVEGRGKKGAVNLLPSPSCNHHSEGLWNIVTLTLNQFLSLTPHRFLHSGYKIPSWTQEMILAYIETHLYKAGFR